MKRSSGLILVMATLALSFGSFQNCSKINPEDLAAAAADGEKVNADLETITNSDEPYVVIDSDVPPVEVVQDEERQTIPEREPAEAQAEVKTEEKKDDHRGSSCQRDKDKSKEDDSETVAIAECLKKKEAEPLTGSVFFMKGKVVIESKNISLIADSNVKAIIRAGDTSVNADSDGARIQFGGIIDRVDNFGGKLVVCGMNVGLIDGFHGNLVLIDSSVDEISNFKGIVKSIHSTIKKFEGKSKTFRQ